MVRFMLRLGKQFSDNITMLLEVAKSLVLIDTGIFGRKQLLDDIAINKEKYHWSSAKFN